MSFAAKIENPSRRDGARTPLVIARDFAALLGAALAVGVGVSLGLMLMVVGLS